MEIGLRISLLLAIFVYFIIIFNLLRKKKLNLKYTLVWLLSALVMLVIVIFPQLLYSLAQFVGVINPVNAVFLVVSAFMLVIILSLTAIVSSLNAVSYTHLDVYKRQMKRHSKPNSSQAAFAHSSTEGCSASETMTFPPRRRPAERIPKSARLFASVPPEVKTSSPSSQPSNRDRTVREWSSTRADDSPRLCREEGLPNCSHIWSVATSATSGNTVVVAA